MAREAEKQQRAHIRECKREQREQEKAEKQYEKEQLLERAAAQVKDFEDLLNSVLSLHKSHYKAIMWEDIESCPPPTKPLNERIREVRAKSSYENYRPNILDRLFRQTDSKRARLREAIDSARLEDDKHFQSAIKQYEIQYQRWKRQKDLASNVLKGDLISYKEVLNTYDPFIRIKDFGARVDVQFRNSKFAEVDVLVRSEDIIPREEKKLLRSGKLAIRPIKQGRLNEMYQDYVCGCSIGIAKEIFALLPVGKVLVTATCKMLNLETGYIEEQPILSVLIPRDTLQEINVTRIDPSAAMKNFIHRISFNKAKGLGKITKLNKDDLN
jgi:hypothetical protein